MQTTDDLAKRQHVRWVATAIGMPIVAFALAATAYLGGQLPAEQGGSTAAKASTTVTRR
jgi:hypothetical protein